MWGILWVDSVTKAASLLLLLLFQMLNTDFAGCRLEWTGMGFKPSVGCRRLLAIFYSIRWVLCSPILRRQYIISLWHKEGDGPSHSNEPASTRAAWLAKIIIKGQFDGDATSFRCVLKFCSCRRGWWSSRRLPLAAAYGLRQGNFGGPTKGAVYLVLVPLYLSIYYNNNILGRVANRRILASGD